MKSYVVLVTLFASLALATPAMLRMASYSHVNLGLPFVLQAAAADILNAPTLAALAVVPQSPYKERSNQVPPFLQA
ncbi:hypothetical protein CH63R_09520 [Colletotrichum higginsianum IMI 349063]|uniref:Uncharacterized protein n=1 Tax=Colletotrichum higginsianum (strain IMI 349063) TaxID=759273 RepID=A0A1B7Y7J3_COLHI|nr:hypothetical protein CH63R_09520 [Colletotrichum higginsianum IMI 349063]OBR07999.1 hypothetical protein CH63R_09520 [Colletotrichum higginsianum IMI 349063]